jgi:hypothetical protein
MLIIGSGIAVGSGITAQQGVLSDGLQLYLNAGAYAGSGTNWQDLSGNGRNFTWASSPSWTNAGPASYFSTLGNLAVGPASNSFGINNTSGYTIFLVMLQNELVSTAAFKFYGNDSFNRGIFSHCTWSDDVVYFDQGGCCDSDTRTSVASGGSQTWNVWTFRRDTNSSNRYIFKNSNILATNTAAAANINLNATAANLGGADEYGGTSSTWNARLGAFLVYNRGLADSEVSSVYNTIRGGWGI